MAIIGLAAGAGWALMRLREDGSRAARRTVIAGGLAALMLVIVFGHLGQQRFFDDRYRGGGSALDRALTLAAPGSRIGIAGAWKVGTLSPIYPLFGPRLENEVGAVGGFVDGAFRAPATRAEFVAAVSRELYQVLIVGREPLPFAAATDEIAWARAAGYRPIARDSRFVLFEPRLVLFGPAGSGDDGQ